MKKLRLAGQTINGVLVLSEVGISKHGKTIIRCRCFCPEAVEFVCLATELRNGHTRSCGCYSRSGEFTRKHGHRSVSRGSQKQSTLYTFWINMRQRCYNTNAPHYEDYGGRGIRVYEPWQDSFETFLADAERILGPKPPVPSDFSGERYWSVDRIDNNFDYHPDNIKWSTPVEQKANQRKRRYWKKPVKGVKESPPPINGEVIKKSRLPRQFRES